MVVPRSGCRTIRKNTTSARRHQRYQHLPERGVLAPPRSEEMRTPHRERDLRQLRRLQGDRADHEPATRALGLRTDNRNQHQHEHHDGQPNAGSATCAAGAPERSARSRRSPDRPWRRSAVRRTCRTPNRHEPTDSTLDDDRTITRPRTVSSIAIVTTRWNDVSGRASHAPILVRGARSPAVVILDPPAGVGSGQRRGRRGETASTVPVRVEHVERRRRGREQDDVARRSQRRSGPHRSAITVSASAAGRSR